MNVYALADLHLSFGVPNKKMDIFGPLWDNHPARIEEQWRLLVRPDDLVLIAGDISWAMTMDEVKPDLAWIDQLPGTKVMIRGNHDYWWSSLKKVASILPPSIKAIHHNSLTINGISICGTRFWDKPETPDDEKIYQRELGRLEMSLKALDPAASCKIAMTHYPPIGFDLEPTDASALFERYGVNEVIFGHLHFPRENRPYFGKARGVNYQLTAADFLNFCPLKIL